MVSVIAQVQAAEGKPYLRLAGCPVSVSELILALSVLGGVNNPYLSPEEAVRFTSQYVAKKAGRAARRLRGEPARRDEFTERGEAAPELPRS